MTRFLKPAALCAGLAASAALLSGCAAVGLPGLGAPPSEIVGGGESSGLSDTIYLAAERLIQRQPEGVGNRSIAITTVVAIEDLKKSSNFGRLASQLVTNRLSQLGFAVKDLNYVGALTVTQTGELALSRDVTELSRVQHAGAVVAGTYTVGQDEIYLNIRLLRAEDGKILSSVDSVLPRTPNVDALVRGY